MKIQRLITIGIALLAFSVESIYGQEAAAAGEHASVVEQLLKTNSQN